MIFLQAKSSIFHHQTKLLKACAHVLFDYIKLNYINQSLQLVCILVSDTDFSLFSNIRKKFNLKNDELKKMAYLFKKKLE